MDLFSFSRPFSVCSVVMQLRVWIKFKGFLVFLSHLRVLLDILWKLLGGNGGDCFQIDKILMIPPFWDKAKIFR